MLNILDCKFYWVTGEAAVAHLAAGKSSAVTFKATRSRPGDKDLLFPGGLQSYDELSTWATDKCIPLVREITFENAEELTEVSRERRASPQPLTALAAPA